MVNLEKYATIMQTSRDVENTSDKYSFISTLRPLSILAEYNWFPRTVQEVKVRKNARNGYQKHIVTLQQGKGDDALVNVGDETAEIILKSAHDGSANFELMGAMRVKVCSNGLIVSAGSIGGHFKIKHIGYTDDAVAKAIEAITDFGPNLVEKVRELKSIGMSDAQQVNFATEALELVNDPSKFVMQPIDLLAARRLEDKDCNLWKCFNRVQENIMHGGLTRKTLQGKSRKTRAIKNIDRTVDINQALWDLTERTARNLRSQYLLN